MNSESPAALLPGSFVILAGRGLADAGGLPVVWPIRDGNRRPISPQCSDARWTGEPQAGGSPFTGGAEPVALPVVVWQSRLRRPTCAKGGKRVLRLPGERR